MSYGFDQNFGTKTKKIYKVGQNIVIRIDEHLLGTEYFRTRKGFIQN